MERRCLIFKVVSIIIICFFTFCQKKDDSYFPMASIIVGRVDVYNSKGMELLKEQQYLKKGDTISVQNDSKIKFELRSKALWYVNRGSKFIVDDLVQLSGNKRRFYLSVLKGQMHIVNDNETNEEYIINIDSFKIRTSGSHITICKDNQDEKYKIVLLSGFATFTIGKGTETVIPQCSKIITSSEKIPEIKPISPTDIIEIKSWVGSTIIETALKKGNCNLLDEKAKNEPPVWKRLPEGTALLNEWYIDTIEAIDPELTPIKYNLIKGPLGLELKENTGEIKFKASVLGEVRLIVEAMDLQNQACTAYVNIKVIKGFSLSLSIPSIVEPFKPLRIVPVTKGINIKNTKLRYDLDGNGIYEIPPDGNFGSIYSIDKYIFRKEGIFYISAEAKSKDGITASVKKKVIVNTPPKASLRASTYEIETGVQLELDASASFDINSPTESLRVRFDIDGDGIWDLPGREEFILQKKVSYAWEKDGIYNVKVQVVDKYGISDIDSIRIKVIKKEKQLTEDAITITVPDSFYTSDSVDLECNIKMANIDVKAIEWYLDNDNIVDKTTVKLKEKFVFKNEGEFNIRCIVIDKNGNQFTKEKKVKVKKRKIQLSAGGPYRGSIYKKITFKGSSDTVGVKKYHWDFNGDGAIDWSSEKISETNFTYSHSGKFIAYFCAEMMDGEKIVDSTTVEIINHPPIAYAGEDVVSEKGKKITLNGIGKDEDENITTYQWDFNGDGIFDWTSSQNGIVEKEFFEYSIAIFKVLDSDSAFGIDSIRIVICPEEMQLIEKGKFCIDRYEYPNKANSIPLTNVTFKEAEENCKKEGKRLCSSSEWESACNGGKEGLKFPYGNTFNPSNCNTSGNPIIKNSIAPSGKFSECKNSYTIFDMSGNVAEWVRSDKKNSYAYGGSWQSGENESRCNSKILLKNDRKYFYVGFRCCK